MTEETAFSLLEEDHIRAELTLEDLKALGVTLLVTRRNYPAEPVAKSGRWKIYRLEDIPGLPEDEVTIFGFGFSQSTR